MSPIITAAITWIRTEYGGRVHPPVIGLRPTIRFQRDVSAWLLGTWSVQIVSLDFDLQTWTGTAQLVFSPGATPDRTYMKKGELIELLDAYRVIGVGMILAVEED